MPSIDIIFFVCIIALVVLFYRNFKVHKLRRWMIEEWFARSVKSIGDGHLIRFGEVYNNAPSYYHMVSHFWIPLSRFKKEYISNLNKFGEIMDKDTKMKEMAESKRNELKNTVYKSVLGICEGIEHDGSYKGNGHHLAQKITDEVMAVLSE